MKELALFILDFWKESLVAIYFFIVLAAVAVIALSPVYVIGYFAYRMVSP